MTQISESTASATSPGSDDVSGGFTRLNPADGLFLRAEHLDRISRYASDLAAAVGAGVGPGVVYGFTCVLSKANNAVYATAGLAFASGRPLRSTETIRVSLADLAPAGNDFYVVEIVPESWPFGSEPVYGGLCEDPCGSGSGIHPYEAEGVRLRLRPDSMPKLGDQENRRNWLASQYFERERQYGGASARSSNAPWLMPNVDDGGVLAITGRPWREGTSSYDDVAVPLGVVWKEDDRWQLDVWTARRDLGDPTPTMAWQWRLGWRPRNVFMAQILQFQAQLATVEFGQVRPLSEQEKKFRELCETASTRLGQGRSQLTKDVKADLDRYKDSFEDEELPSFSDLGFDELPPAGYLPVSFESLEEADVAASKMFGDVDVRVRFCRADYVAHAIEQVQHMDRIPLTDYLTPPKIDLLVPRANSTDLKTTMPSPAYYGWSAFVRRREDEQPREEVDVFVWYPRGVQGRQDFGRRMDNDPTLPPVDEFKMLGRVSYPAAEWAVPVDESGDNKSTWQKVHDLFEEEELLGVLGYTRDVERQALAAVRASLFVIPSEPVDHPITLPVAYVIIDPKWPTSPPEAIVVALWKPPPVLEHGDSE